MLEYVTVLLTSTLDQDQKTERGKKRFVDSKCFRKQNLDKKKTVYTLKNKSQYIHEKKSKKILAFYK